MRHDEPATMMHLIKPLLLLLCVLALLLIVDRAWGDGIRIYDVAGSDGPDVVLSQVAELDGEYANQFANLVVGRFDKDSGKLELQTSAILEAMQGEGARLGMIDFSGFTKCVVHRTFNQPQRVASSKTEPAAANFHQKGDNAVTLHSPTTVRTLIEKRVATEIGLGQASLSIEFSDRDMTLLEQSAVAGRYEVQPTSPMTLGKVTFQVQGYEGTRKQGESATVTALVQQRVIAVIANDVIPRGEIITRRRVRLAEVLIDNIAQAYLQETALVNGQVASTTIRPGELVTSAKVKLPVAVKRRERVSVELKSPGVKITFNGVAQDEGAVGETIEVENALTRERFSAVVVARGKVVAGERIQEDKPESGAQR